MLGDLGDDGVAEGSNSVHPSGNPISHSTHVGFSAPPTTTTSGSPPCALGDRFAPRNDRLSRLMGVGHDEHPRPCMWGTKGARRYNRPVRIEPELGKISKDPGESQGKVPCDVLQEREAGS